MQLVARGGLIEQCRAICWSPRSVPEIRVSRGLTRLSVCTVVDPIINLASGTGMLSPSSSLDGTGATARNPAPFRWHFFQQCAETQGSAGATPGFELSRRIKGEMPFQRCPIGRWHGDEADADDLVQDSLLGSRQRASVAAGSGFARRAVHDHTQPVSLQIT